MKTGRLAVMILGLLGLFASPAQLLAGIEEYTLEFIPTRNAPPGIRGTMTIEADVGKPSTKVEFKLSGAYPNTVYTLWTVFNLLKEPLPAEKPEVPSIPALTRPGFPAEGNGVSPLARLDAGFTSGMGVDPGASFITDHKGNGKVQVKLDYDLIRTAPLSNKNLIIQCAPTVTMCEKQAKVTTTWLRQFIGEFRLEDRASMCTNYDPSADPDNPRYDPVASTGMNTRFWQCIDPATVDSETGSGLPRVHTFEFDHFRLANHPDHLTHGFIGGNATDHWIDMVGRRADIFYRLRRK